MQSGGWRVTQQDAAGPDLEEFTEDSALTPPKRAGARRHDPLDGDHYEEEGAALCLSGGGLKAAMFHVGGLIRLNELGLLRTLRRVCSVSGGSITGAYLGMKWTDLDWDTNGRAQKLDDEVVRPLVRFCLKGIERGPLIEDLLSPFSTVSEGLIRAYRDDLFKDATLQSFPDEGPGAPGFFITAANLQLNTLWRMSKGYVADYRVGRINRPAIPLAVAVAASSAYPPYYSPVVLDLSAYRVESMGGVDRNFRPFNRQAEMGDGGLYDNLALEPAWKRFGTLLVSNAGAPFPELEHAPRDWPRQVLRSIAMVHRQAENNRVRWLMAMARGKERKVAYWTVRNSVASYQQEGKPTLLSLGPEDTYAAAVELGTLQALGRPAMVRLVHHGYAMANAAAVRWLGAGDKPEARFAEVA